MDFVQNRAKIQVIKTRKFIVLLVTRLSIDIYRICSGIKVIKLSLKSNSSMDFIFSIPKHKRQRPIRFVLLYQKKRHTGDFFKAILSHFKCC